MWECKQIQGYIFFVLWPAGEQVCSGNFGEPQVDPGKNDDKNFLMRVLINLGLVSPIDQ